MGADCFDLSAAFVPIADHNRLQVRSRCDDAARRRCMPLAAAEAARPLSATHRVRPAADDAPWPSHHGLQRGRQGNLNASLTRLERPLFRLEAQHACLDWAFGDFAASRRANFRAGTRARPDLRSSFRTHLPDREMYVFDREVDCFADCTPPGDRLSPLASIGDTLAAAAARFQGRVALAHTDLRFLHGEITIWR